MCMSTIQAYFFMTVPKVFGEKLKGILFCHILQPPSHPHPNLHSIPEESNLHVSIALRWLFSSTLYQLSYFSPSLYYTEYDMGLFFHDCTKGVGWKTEWNSVLPYYVHPPWAISPCLPTMLNTILAYFFMTVPKVLGEKLNGILFCHIVYTPLSDFSLSPYYAEYDIGLFFHDCTKGVGYYVHPPTNSWRIEPPCQYCA